MNEIGGTTPGRGRLPGSAVLRYAAFTDHGGGGNPAGVVLDAAGLDEAARLAMAARVGYSETAFVEAAGGGGQYRIRYFSPKSEVAFCGHATIATAVAIAERDGPGLLHFDTLAGPVAVRTSPAPAGLTARSPASPRAPALPRPRSWRRRWPRCAGAARTSTRVIPLMSPTPATTT